MEVDYQSRYLATYHINDCGSTASNDDEKMKRLTQYKSNNCRQTVKHVEMINKINFNENLIKLVLSQSFGVCVCVCAHVFFSQNAMHVYKIVHIVNRLTTDCPQNNIFIAFYDELSMQHQQHQQQQH